MTKVFATCLCLKMYGKMIYNAGDQKNARNSVEMMPLVEAAEPCAITGRMTPEELRQGWQLGALKKGMLHGSKSDFKTTRDFYMK